MDDARSVIEALARSKPMRRPNGHFDQPQPLGPRQQQLVELLSEGPWSVLALMRRLGARRVEERAAVHDTLHRLRDRGVLTITGLHGKSDMAGVTVALVEPGPCTASIQIMHQED
jgi:hypothetical protein